MADVKTAVQFRVEAAVLSAIDGWAFWRLQLSCGHSEIRRARRTGHLVERPQTWAKCNTCAKARIQKEHQHEKANQQE